MSDGRRRAAALAALQKGLGWLRDAVAEGQDGVDGADGLATEQEAASVEPVHTDDEAEAEPHVPATLMREGIGEVQALEPEDVLLDAAQLVQQAGVGWELTFLDLREDGLRALGMVPDAISLSPTDLATAVADLDAGRTWVVLAADDASAADAALALRAAGHDDVFAMEGGLDAWRRAGGPIAGVS